jgi:hypothetical protein
MCCFRMYESCKTAVFISGNQTVGNYFGNGELFCDKMFIDTELFVTVAPDSDRKCFDPLTTG